MDRDTLLDRVLKRARRRLKNEPAAGGAVIEVQQVEAIVDMLSEHWNDVPKDFSEHVINICVALVCKDKRSRQAPSNDAGPARQAIRF